MRLLELYCGIGGCSIALGSRVSSTLAIDVNRIAASVYEQNLGNQVQIVDLRAIAQERLAAFEADIWWLSPPCQPFTRRGKRLDTEDRRSESFLSLLPKIEAIRPPAIALENVAGFLGSETHSRLLKVLDRAGYGYHERLLCPQSLGWPNRRERYYLVAKLGVVPVSRSGSAQGPTEWRELRDFVDPRADRLPEVQVDRALAARYGEALNIVDRDDPDAVTATFTSAYGRSHVRSGSYLRTADGIRRFTPREILSLLGFPASYELPSDLPIGNAWRLVGNSLSLPAVREVLRDLD